MNKTLYIIAFAINLGFLLLALGSLFAPQGITEPLSYWLLGKLVLLVILTANILFFVYLSESKEIKNFFDDEEDV